MKDLKILNLADRSEVMVPLSDTDLSKIQGGLLMRDRPSVVDHPILFSDRVGIGPYPDDVDAICALDCFISGTPIRIPGGETRPIESLKMGDRILAFNSESGVVVEDEIVSLCVTPGTFDLFLIQAGEEKIAATQNHSFLVSRGWRPLRELTPDAPIRGLNRELRTRVEYFSVVDSLLVFNLRVRRNGNFLVGEQGLIAQGRS